MRCEICGLKWCGVEHAEAGSGVDHGETKGLGLEASVLEVRVEVPEVPFRPVVEVKPIEALVIEKKKFDRGAMMRERWAKRKSLKATKAGT
jgi:hypothetical protein